MMTKIYVIKISICWSHASKLNVDPSALKLNPIVHYDHDMREKYYLKPCKYIKPQNQKTIKAMCAMTGTVH